MKKLKRTHAIQLLVAVFLTFICFNAHAQKLPNKQEVSLRAPANIIVDGYATEWGDQYQAYNKATEVFYSIANDDNNLYLIIHATKSRIIEKIIEGGISFTLDPTNKKNDDKNITVLFPLLTMPAAWSALHNAGKTLTETLSGKTPDDKYGLMRKKDSVLNAKPTTEIDKANQGLVANLKEIKFSGISSITDTIGPINPKSIYYKGLPLHLHPFKLIPIDNHDGIEAMTQFDDKGSYTYELAIPIKYLGFDINYTEKFSYHITLHSRIEDERSGSSYTYGRSPNGQWEMQNIDLSAQTDFWGEYTLAKK